MEGTGVVTALTWVQEIRASGLIMGQDFVWRYIKGELDELGLQEVRPRAVEFHFKEAKWATFYKLKWSSEQ